MYFTVILRAMKHKESKEKNDRNLSKFREKKDKYSDVARELRKVWIMKVRVIAVVTGTLRTVPEAWYKGLEVLEIRRRIGTIQAIALLRSDGILRRIQATWGDLLTLRHHLLYSCNTNTNGNIIKHNLWTSMNERTHFFIKIYLSYFILERVDVCVVCGRWVERHILRERTSSSHIFFQEPGGANACTPLQARQRRLWLVACPSLDCDSLYSV